MLGFFGAFEVFDVLLVLVVFVAEALLLVLQSVRVLVRFNEVQARALSGPLLPRRMIPLRGVSVRV